jgi:hypothetical protein
MLEFAGEQGGYSMIFFPLITLLYTLRFLYAQK